MDLQSRQLSKQVVVTDEMGLHARTAAILVKYVQHAKSKVYIIKDGEKKDASDILDILSLACCKNSRITFEIENPSDINILNDLVRLVENGFKE